MTISHASTSSTAQSGFTSVAYRSPAAITADDYILCAITNKYPPAAPNAATMSGIGFAQLLQQQGGAGSAAADSGDVYLTLFSKTATGAETPDATTAVGISGGDSAHSRVVSFARSGGSGWDVATTSGVQSTAAANWSVAGGAISLAPGDIVVVIMGKNGDADTSLASQALAASGITFSSYTQITYTGTTNGDDCAQMIGYWTVSSGTGTVAPTFSVSMSGSAADTAGSVAFVRLREASSSQTVSVNQATETDTAQAIVAAQRQYVGLVTATNTAQPITVVQRIAVGQATETDTAQSFATRQQRTLGQATETDLAQPISSQNVTYVAVGQASESDAAQPIVAQQRQYVGQAAETDAAQSISSQSVTYVAVGQATETDTAQPVVAQQRVTLGQAQEVDQALQMGTPGAPVLGLPAETDTAQPIVVQQQRAVLQAAETETAQPILAHQRVPVGQAVETCEAGAIRAVQLITVGMALEIDTTFALAALQRVLIGQAMEFDLAHPLATDFVPEGSAEEAIIVPFEARGIVVPFEDRTIRVR